MPAIGDAIKLTRKDLTYFHQDTVDLVLKMQDAGWKIIRTSKGHARLLAPDGVTTLGMSRNQDSVKFIKRGLEKYNAEHGIKEVVVTATPKTVGQKWPCPRPGCPKTFMSDTKLNIHMGTEHDGLLKCPDCDEMFKRPASLGLHRTNKHGYVSPTKEKRKQAEANRKKKAEEVVDEEAEKALKAGVEGSRKAGRQLVRELKDADFDKIVSGEVEEGVLDNVIAAVDKGDILADENPRAYFIEDVPTPVKESIDEPTPEETPSFYDDRNSWTIDLDRIMHWSVADMLSMMNAAGLEAEIRVWRNNATSR